MKKVIFLFTILCFWICLLIPIITFNHKPDAISVIDNRKLAENPFSSKDGDLTNKIDSYVSDRIGLRSDMILSYSLLNYNLWDVLVHPSYKGGINGEIFGGISNIQYTDYHETFLNAVAKLQEYCVSRDTPFLFVINPSKVNSMPEFLAPGINYDMSWREKFVEGLNKRSINYIDNYDILKGGVVDGQRVFNQKYDANHWNSLGAFYGVNNILNTMKEQSFPDLHINSLEEFEESKKMETSLLVSEFPIEEETTNYTFKGNLKNISSLFSNIELHPNFKGFSYLINEKRKEEGAPKVLVFQGSYMNGKGAQFLRNSFGEYISVHDYQNVLNLDYYFNIFQPDYVIFEVADYTLIDSYFSYDVMKNLNFNPTMNFYNDTIEISPTPLIATTNQTGDLTDILINIDNSFDYIYLLDNNIRYDMKKIGQNQASLTISGEINLPEAKVITIKDGNIIQYLISE